MKDFLELANQSQSTCPTRPLILTLAFMFPCVGRFMYTTGTISDTTGTGTGGGHC